MMFLHGPPPQMGISQPPRSLSPQPGHLHAVVGGIPAPAGPSYAVAPTPQVAPPNGGWPLPPGSFVAGPSVCQGARMGAISPMAPALRAGPMQLDRAPTPLRVPQYDRSAKTTWQPGAMMGTAMERP